MVQRTVEEDRKQFSIKSFKFNRFLWQRYSLSLFFFTSLYWFLILLLGGSGVAIVPLLLVVAAIPALIEQIQLLNHHHNHLKWTRGYFLVQVVGNGVLIPLILIRSVFINLYPFLTISNQSQIAMVLFLFVGVLLALANLQHLAKIKANKDKKYTQIQQFEKNI